MADTLERTCTMAVTFPGKGELGNMDPVNQRQPANQIA